MRTLPPRLVSLLLPLVLTGLTAAAPTVPAGEKDPAPDAPFKPKAYDVTRYSKNFEKKSPFEFDPPPTEPPITEDYFKDISLGGYCGNGNTMSVYLLTGKEKKRITVYGDGSSFKKRDTSGFRILSISRGKSLATTTVLLERNGQQKAVGFEKDTLTAKGAGSGPGGGAPDAGKKGQPGKLFIDKYGHPVPQSGGVQAGPGKGAPVPQYQPPPPFIPGQSDVQFEVKIRTQSGNSTLTGQQQQQLALEQTRLRQAEAAAALNARMQEQNGGGGGAAQPDTRHRKVVLPTQGN